MGVGLLLGVFMVQAVIIAVIIVVLRAKLEGQLMDSALRHLATQPPSESKRITVVTSRTLPPPDAGRFQRAAVQGMGSAVQVVFTVDPLLQGGAVIRIGEKVLDHSLRDRLRRAFGR